MDEALLRQSTLLRSEAEGEDFDSDLRKSGRMHAAPPIRQARCIPLHLYASPHVAALLFTCSKRIVCACRYATQRRYTVACKILDALIYAVIILCRYYAAYYAVIKDGPELAVRYEYDCPGSEQCLMYDAHT